LQEALSFNKNKVLHPKEKEFSASQKIQPPKAANIFGDETPVLC
jgi:hypothetical protein